MKRVHILCAVTNFIVAVVTLLSSSGLVPELKTRLYLSP